MKGKNCTHKIGGKMNLCFGSQHKNHNIVKKIHKKNIKNYSYFCWTALLHLACAHHMF
jgi:hypothetical protein